MIQGRWFNVSAFSRVVYVLCALGVCAFPAFADAPLPQFAKARLGSDRFTMPVTATAFGAGGLFVTATANGYIRLWDTNLESMRWEARPTTLPIEAIALTRSAAVAATRDGHIFVLDIASGVEARRFTIAPCSSPCALRSIQATDTLIFTLSSIPHASIASPPVMLRLWSASDGTLLQSHALPSASAIALSSTNDHVAWIESDIAAPEPQPAYVNLAAVADLGHPTRLSCALKISSDTRLVFSPDAQSLAVLGEHLPHFDQLILCLWATSSAQNPQNPTRTKPTLTTVLSPASANDWLTPEDLLFSSDSAWLSASWGELGEGCSSPGLVDSTQQVFEVSSGKRFNPDDSALPALSFASHDQPKVPPPWMTQTHHQDYLASIAANHDGSRIASLDTSGQSLIWQVGQASPLAALPTLGDAVLFSPDGALYDAGTAVLPDQGDRDILSRVGRPSRWNPLTGAQIHLPLRHASDPDKPINTETWMIQTLHWLPDGNLLSCRDQHEAEETSWGDPQGPVHGLFETIQPNGTVSPISATPAAFSFCLSPSGVSPAALRAFISTFTFPEDSGVVFTAWQVIDLKTGAVLLEDRVPVYAVALSPDGKRAAISMDRRDADPPSPPTLRVYDVDSRAVLGEAEIQGEALGSPLVFSPDSKHLLSADGDGLVIRDLTGAAPKKTLPGHTNMLSAITFSGDGKTLFSAQSDGIIYAWDWAAISATLP